MSQIASAPVPIQTARLFDHVVVALDERPESLIAAAQARCLCGPAGRLEVIAVAETHLAAHAGFEAPLAAEQIVAGAEDALDQVRELDPARGRVLAGSIAGALAAAAHEASLVALGTRRRRLASLAAHGLESRVLDRAPCSVLLARPGWGPRPPQRILFCLDGSPEARRARVAAESIARRLGSDVVPLIALGDEPVIFQRAYRDDALFDPRGAIMALASAPADSLVVVAGSGRQVIVAEQVARRAHCSVLVVRTEADQDH